MGPTTVNEVGVFFPLQPVVLAATSDCSTVLYSALTSASTLSGDASTTVALPAMALGSYKVCIGQKDGSVAPYPFTTVSCIAPLVISVANTARLARAGGTVITVLGSDFNNGVADVLALGSSGWGSLSVHSDTRLEFVSPSLSGAPPLGTVPVTVVLVDGRNATAEFPVEPLGSLSWSISAGSGPTLTGPLEVYSAAGGDVNGDGDADLIVGTDDGVYVALGDSSGSFPTFARWGSSRVCSDVAAADLNSDALTDVVCGTPTGTSVYVLTANALGGATETALAVGMQGPAVVVLADVLGQDGHPDLVVGLSGGTAQVATFAGSASGLAAMGTFLGPSVAGNITSLRVWDVNRDGNAELVAAASWGEVMMFESTDGTGFNTPTTMVSATRLTPGSVAVLDFDGDSGADIFVPRGSGSELFKSDSSTPTSWTSNLNLTVATGPTACLEAAMVDLDFDGYPDLLFSNRGGITYYLGQGGGTISSVKLGYLPHVGGDLLFYDVNGDFYPDVITPGCDNSSPRVCVAMAH